MIAVDVSGAFFPIALPALGQHTDGANHAVEAIDDRHLDLGLGPEPVAML